MAIGKKQNTSDADWRIALQNIENEISENEIREVVSKTVEDIRRKTDGKNVAYSWSAGKDSIVLGYVCELAGIHNSVFVHCDLEYKAFMDWVKNNLPANCEMINTKQDLKWLARHQEMLFPQDARTAALWFKGIQHRGQEMYYREHNLDMILLGRRRADGNYVGSRSNLYTNRKGITRFSPLADWSHEQILACIHYFNLPTPPIYDWKNGYVCGTHCWPARQWTGSIENGWKEVYEIDPDIVKEAAQYIQSAGDFLNE